MAQRFKAILGILLIVIALLIFYTFAGASDTETFSVYQIDVTDPSSSWMDVTVTLQPAPRLFVDLSLYDRRQLGKNRVRDISAARGDNSLLTWEPFPGRPDIQRIWTGFSSEPVTFRYQAHGQWRKDGTQMFSYLGPDYGYLLGEVFLYTPVTLQEVLQPGRKPAGGEIGRSMVAFKLPPGWRVVSPLDIKNLEVQTAVLRDVYFSVGPFEIDEMQLGSDTFKLGIWEGLPAEERQKLRAAIPLLYTAMQEKTGFANKADTCFRALTVLPSEPIYGSVTGAGSLVSENNLASITGGLFGWWNGITLTSAPDALWLKEGFTTYYQARLLYQNGLLSQKEFLALIQTYQNKAWPGSDPQPADFVEASKQLAKLDDPTEDHVLTYGGALLAFQLDQALQAQGSSLDRLWPALAALDRPADTQAVLDALETLGGEDLRASTKAILYGQAALEPAGQPQDE